MSKTPFISVIVPVYNAAGTVAACLNSVLKQSFADFELIAVDDGSTDSSAEIIASIAETDLRVKLLRKPNGGVSSARNAGLDVAQGSFVCFLDSDDLLSDYALQRLADSSFADFVAGGYSNRSGSLTVLPPETGNYSEVQDCIDGNYRHHSSLFRAVWGKLFSLKLIKLPDKPLRFDENFSYGEDMVFVWKYLCRCKSLVMLDSPVYVYSDTPGGLGAGLGSDRHLEQLFKLIPAYSDCIAELSSAFPESSTVHSLYHRDLVGRLVCRALNVFATRKSALLSAERISFLYSYMDKDHSLSLFSLRKGQLPNLLLYKLHCPRFSCRFYKLSSALCGFFNIKLKRY